MGWPAAFVFISHPCFSGSFFLSPPCPSRGPPFLTAISGEHCHKPTIAFRFIFLFFFYTKKKKSFPLRYSKQAPFSKLRSRRTEIPFFKKIWWTDTNVVSNILRSRPNLLPWPRRQHFSSLSLLQTRHSSSFRNHSFGEKKPPLHPRSSVQGSKQFYIENGTILLIAGQLPLFGVDLMIYADYSVINPWGIRNPGLNNHITRFERLLPLGLVSLII